MNEFTEQQPVAQSFLRRHWIISSVLGAGVAAAVALGITNVAFMMSYDNGNRVGEIVQFSLDGKGFFFKTKEGLLSLGGFANKQVAGQGQAVVAHMWDFSVIDDEVAKQIDEAQTRKFPVKLHYRQRYFKLWWYGDTAYIVDNVERVHDTDIIAPATK